MKTAWKRIIAAVLAIIICVSALPAVWADYEEDEYISNEYQLEEEWNNNRKHATVIDNEPGSLVQIQGTISDMDDIDVFKFVPNSSMPHGIYLSEIPDDKHWLLWLMDENWNVIKSSLDNDMPWPSVSYDVDAETTYYIVVAPSKKFDDNYSKNDDETYLLEIEPAIGYFPRNSIRYGVTLELPDEEIYEVDNIDEIRYEPDDPSVRVSTESREIISELFLMLENVKFTGDTKDSHADGWHWTFDLISSDGEAVDSITYYPCSREEKDSLGGTGWLYIRSNGKYYLVFDGFWTEKRLDGYVYDMKRGVFC